MFQGAVRDHTQGAVDRSRKCPFSLTLPLLFMTLTLSKKCRPVIFQGPSAGVYLQ